MRAALLLLALTVLPPRTVIAQAAPKPAEVEVFNVAGLPQTPSTDKERELFALLRDYRKGDYATATRIHLMLADYYREQGAKARFDECLLQAAEAWAVSSAEERASANSFRRTFSYADDLGITHVWDFFRDGTYAHKLLDAAKRENGPTEAGWYSLSDGKMRLWQLQPLVDREVTFEFLGEDGRDGAVLDGVKMTPPA
jgi:hypothetical protein